MNILSVGGRRLHLNIRIERVPANDPDRARRAYQARGIRKELFEERYRREYDRMMLPGRF